MAAVKSGLPAWQPPPTTVMEGPWAGPQHPLITSSPSGWCVAPGWAEGRPLGGGAGCGGRGGGGTGERDVGRWIGQGPGKGTPGRIGKTTVVEQPSRSAGV